MDEAQAYARLQRWLTEDGRRVVKIGTVAGCGLCVSLCDRAGVHLTSAFTQPASEPGLTRTLAETIRIILNTVGAS